MVPVLARTLRDITHAMFQCAIYARDGQGSDKISASWCDQTKSSTCIICAGDVRLSDDKPEPSSTRNLL